MTMPAKGVWGGAHMCTISNDKPKMDNHVNYPYNHARLQRAATTPHPKHPKQLTRAATVPKTAHLPPRWLPGPKRLTRASACLTPRKRIQHLIKGLIASKMGPSSRDRPCRLMNGPTASRTEPQPHRRTRHLKSDPTVSKMDATRRGRAPPPQNWMRRLKSDPAVSKVSKMGPLHRKRTRRVRDGPTASKLDPSPQKRPRRLKSGPEVSKSEPPHHE
ncbi:hypothetical protein BU15DRAFT_60815 [Melanogaster broomeanus]|nr:hypothetical protein BU15DRAFT_60815 [Melanogaster broomeanus]